MAKEAPGSCLDQLVEGDNPEAAWRAQPALDGSEQVQTPLEQAGGTTLHKQRCLDCGAICVLAVTNDGLIAMCSDGAPTDKGLNACPRRLAG